jgi:hypothetical protein
MKNTGALLGKLKEKEYDPKATGRIKTAVYFGEISERHRCICLGILGGSTIHASKVGNLQEDRYRCICLGKL